MEIIGALWLWEHSIYTLLGNHKETHCAELHARLPITLQECPDCERKSSGTRSDVVSVVVGSASPLRLSLPKMHFDLIFDYLFTAFTQNLCLIESTRWMVDGQKCSSTVLLHACHRVQLSFIIYLSYLCKISCGFSLSLTNFPTVPVLARSKLTKISEDFLFSHSPGSVFVPKSHAWM